jgi:hypothetical protein
MSVVWARDSIGSSGGEDSSNLGCVPLQQALIISQSVRYEEPIWKESSAQSFLQDGGQF